MVRRPLLFTLLAALALTAWTQPTEPKSRRYRSPNFELYAEVKLKRPVRVVAFGSERDLKRLRGAGDSAYAFYKQSRDRNYIVFQEPYESFEKALDLRPSDRLRKRIEDARDEVGKQ